MSSLSQHLIQNKQAHLVDGIVRHFGECSAEFTHALENSAKCPLLSLGIVAFSGSECVEFINGQFTTDCTKLSEHHSQLSAWCDPKGRVLFLFVLYQSGDHTFAVLPKVQIPKFISRLQMYILRADVQLEDVSEKKSIIGIAGKPAPGYFDLALPEQAWETAQSENSVVIRHGFGRERYLIVESQSESSGRWESLALTCIGENVWTALDVCTGIPRTDESGNNHFLPQQLNLDRIDGVSFSKGCYPGQEIIARLKYRGEVKKRLRSFSHDSASDVVAGTRILDTNGEHLRGHVLHSQRIDATHSFATAIIDVEAEIATLSLAGHSNVKLEEIALPYPPLS